MRTGLDVLPATGVDYSHASWVALLRNNARSVPACVRRLEDAVSTATQTIHTESPAVAVACIMTVVVAAVIEVTANSGWPLPLPSAWCLIAVLVGARFGGLPGGMWSASVMLAYAVHTSGFTTGHTSASMLWGQSGERIVAFGFAAVLLVGLVHTQLGSALTAQAIEHLQRRQERRRDDALWGPKDVKSSAELERAFAVMCSVSRRSANDLNNHLAVILGRCELQLEAPSIATCRESHAAIAAAAARCHTATAALLQCAMECGGGERKS
jgi:hypothetical protein